jgi:hypothetical protein
MRALFIGVLVAATLGASGCVTPSIPIPPPDPARMTFEVTTDNTGMITAARFSYPAEENYKGGVVYVYNRTTGEGVIKAVNADGSIGPTQSLAATLNNQIQITVENADQTQTVGTCVLLQEGAPSSYCP